jgi:hypothetical protein
MKRASVGLDGPWRTDDDYLLEYYEDGDPKLPNCAGALVFWSIARGKEKAAHSTPPTNLLRGMSYVVFNVPFIPFG